MQNNQYHVARLIHDYLTGSISDAHRRELDRWISASPSNRTFFEQACDRERLAKKQGQLQQVNREVAFRQFKKRSGIAYRQRLIRIASVAAAIVLFVGAVSLWRYHAPLNTSPLHHARIEPGKPRASLVLDDGTTLNLHQNTDQTIRVSEHIRAHNSGAGIIYDQPTQAQASDAINILTTPRGGEFFITLSDGSTVYLNSASELKYPVAFDAEKREVHLSGEAYFEVKSDAHRPFYVVMEGMKVRVYGTRFNINTFRKDRIETVLEEGAIAIVTDTGAEELPVAPGQLARFHRSDASLTLHPVNPRAYTSWKEGYFIFEDTNLADMMNTLSRWYDVDVLFVSEGAKSLHFTGHLRRYDQIDNILKAISSGVDVQFTINNRTIMVSR